MFLCRHLVAFDWKGGSDGRGGRKLWLGERDGVRRGQEHGVCLYGGW